MSTSRQRPFTLELIGPPVLRGSDGVPVRLRTRKHLGVLILLAWGAPRSVRRERLTDLFWPQARKRAARHSLAQAVLALRRLLGAGTIISQGDTLRLLPDQVGVDLFSEDLDFTRLERELLEDFELVDAPEFDRWKDQFRANAWTALHPRIAARIDVARESGVVDLVDQLGTVLSRGNPYSESGAEARIWALSARGDRTSALREYERFSHVLDRDLSAKPGARLQAMARRLRDPPARVRAVGESRVHSYEGRTISLVGRQTSHRDLYREWRNAVDRGTTSTALLFGEPGIGKSALVEHIARAVLADGGVATVLRARPGDHEAPFACCDQLITELIQSPGAAGARPSALAELTRICPAVRSRFPGVPSPDPVPSNMLASRVRSALRELITAITDEHPIAIFYEDADVADQASIRAVDDAVSGKLNAPVFLCFTASSSLRRSSGAGWDHVVELGPLSQTESRSFVSRLQPQQGGPDALRSREVDRIISLAGGNPLALQLLVTDFLRRGPSALLSAVDGLGVLGAEPTGQRVLNDFFARQCSSLCESTRQVLHIGAILGTFGRHLELFEAFGATPMQLADASRELVELGIWESQDGVLSFRHSLSRLAAYVSIPEPVRRMLHGRAYELLIGDGLSSGAALLAVARHAWRSGRRREATQYGIDAAKAFLGDWALTDTTYVLEELRMIVDAEADKSVLRYLNGTLLSIQAQYREAEPELRMACSDRLLREENRLEAQVRLANGLRRSRKKSVQREAERLLEDASLAAEELRAVGILGMALTLRCQLAATQCDEQAIKNCGERLRSLTHTFGENEASVQFGLAFTSSLDGNLRGARYRLHNAIRLGMRTTNWELLASSYIGLGVVLHGLGQFRRAELALHRSTEICDQLDNHDGAVRAQSNLAALEILRGDAPLALERLGHSLTIDVGQVDVNRAAELLVNSMDAALQCNDLKQASELSERLVDLTESDNDGQVRVEGFLGLADYHLFRHEHHLAIMAISEASALANGQLYQLPEPTHLIRLDSYRIWQTEGLAASLSWLDGIDQERIQSRKRLEILTNVLRSSLRFKQGSVGREAVSQAIRVAESANAVGVLPSLHWSGFLP